MAPPQKTKKPTEGINNRLAPVKKSGKYTLGPKTVLRSLRNPKGLGSESSPDDDKEDELRHDNTSDATKQEKVTEDEDEDEDEGCSGDDANNFESCNLENVDETTSTSAFHRHMGHVLTNEDVDNLTKLKWKYEWEIPATDKLRSKWVGTVERLSMEGSNDVAYEVKQKLYKHWLDIPKASGFADMNSRLSYRDIMNCNRKPFYLKGEEDSVIVDAYLMHALNHVFKTRDIVSKNNAKLTWDQKDEKDEILEGNNFLDRGFTRPKVMFILPLGSIALRVVKRLIHLIPASYKTNVEHIDRFLEDFGTIKDEEDDERLKAKKRAKPKDSERLFGGNNNDHFMIGIKLTRRSVKLYSDFYTSDIIVASPLGLVTGLVQSLKDLVPNTDIRFCVRHLYANFKEKFKGLKLKRLLWEAASGYNKEEHMAALKEIQVTNKDAFLYLNAIDKEQWSRSNFNTSTKCDLICNNISEAFNKYILEARDKPIITMLEMIRRQLMVRLQNKREKAVKQSGPICPKIMKKIDDNSLKSRDCTPYYAGNDTFEVREKGGHCCVNMFQRECDCKEWSLTGIPCKHAMVAVRYLRGDPFSYTNDCYSTERYRKAYEGIIYPIPDSRHWKEDAFVEIVPPKMRRQPGRPAKCRKKAPDEVRKKASGEGKKKAPDEGKKKASDEGKDRLVISKVGSIMKCSQCRGVGHNKRRCNQARRDGLTKKSNGRKASSSKMQEAEGGQERRTRKRKRSEIEPSTSMRQTRSSQVQSGTPMTQASTIQQQPSTASSIKQQSPRKKFKKVYASRSMFK